jgi:peptidoglycan/LPS O-acetylase OafA/YrhL
MLRQLSLPELFMKKHFLVLDSFRGLCACLVAMSHFDANSIFQGIYAFETGAIYVDFFFVLSGFVIFANYEDKLRNGYSLGKFMFLRLGRLWPLHIAVLMAFVGADLLQLVFNFGGTALYKPFSTPGESPKDILAMFFLVHSLNVNEHLALNGPSWSISVEFYTYLVFGLLLTFCSRHYKTLIVMLTFAAAVALYILHGNLYAKLDYGFLRCVYGFGCGALIWMLYKATHEKVENLYVKKNNLTWIEAATLTGIVIYIQFFSAQALSMIGPILISGMIYLFAFEGGAISRFLKAKPFLFLGLLSYSVYMTHMFISDKFFKLPIRLIENRTDMQITIVENGKKLFFDNVLYGTMLELFYLLVVIACSFISYKLIEEPFRNVSRRLVQKSGKDGQPDTAQKIYDGAR